MRAIKEKISPNDHNGKLKEIHAKIDNIATAKMAEIMTKSWFLCDLEIGNWLNGSRPFGSSLLPAMMYANI